ncbi:PLP-dependent aminotransferase family protein [Granulosicoccus antarcticus]|uniref:HTH-type transcriptional regulatory protein GabR n=1 Tax=Granulosicoccus antarcticus IMCC3135 TaxID=1192854 RepID=A0A2Z2NPG3_9GAMM|nr:PLP-dependent aminotransferase family protein [Granulosicoccus antarcticus]ASJ71558.1 HTH-type transcriptional regulatory protein GabR [Granulosicoccus antarcticus IMCC3135]
MNSWVQAMADGLFTPELLDTLRTDTQSPLPRVRQLYLNLYSAIERGLLPYDARLPSSRTLSAQLGLGRNAVISVYEQLASEGLLSANGRRGTRVARHVKPPPSYSVTEWPRSLRISSNHSRLSSGGELAPGEPDAQLFPHDIWRKAQATATRKAANRLGYRAQALIETRTSIARYLANYRSLQVDPEQIVVTSGTRQSLALTANLFADPGDTAWVECPGYLGAVDAFRQSGLHVRPCGLDADGLILPLADVPLPRLIYLTPCFQYPMGMPLGAQRREALLDLARQNDSIIFEDDYDSEFRDDSQPRPALAAESAGARVLHAGTFSKLLFPAIRVGWLVVPPEAVADAHQCLRVIGGGSNTIAQAVVAELLDNGSIARHLRHARQIYGQRRQALITALDGCELFEPINQVSGSLSLVLRLSGQVPMKELVSALDKAGIGAQPLEHLDWQQPSLEQCKAIVIGLGNVDTMAIPATVARLTTALTSLPCSPRAVVARS